MTRSLEQLENDARFYLSRTFNRSWNRPDWVSINLTLKCNLSCTMCTTCYDVPSELSRREIFDLLDQISLWGVRILNPLGGEPFVRPDLVEILEYACRKDFYVTLTTNGTLITPEHARGIARIATDRLHFNFSIDGFREVHDRIRGPGMLERTLQGLLMLREADAAAGSPPRKILINSVVNDLNLDTVPAFLEYCRGLGVQGVQLLNLFKKRGPEIPREIRHLWIPRERLGVLDRVVGEVLELKRASNPQEFAVVNTEHELEIMKAYYRGNLPPRHAKCYAGWKELYVNADGSVIMCDGELDFLNGAFGNIRERTLQELWDSDALRTRREVVKACTSPCIQDCYLRESSDSMSDIVRSVGDKLLFELKKHIIRRDRKWVPLPETTLTLELSDVADVHPPHAPERVRERFDQLIGPSPVPFSRVYEDPFEFYEMRNRGYLNFNRGFMGFELVRKFIPELVRAGVRFDALKLGHRGDPLLHPEFSLVLQYILDQMRKESVFGELQIETYGTLLNTEYVDICTTRFQVPMSWIIQLDASTRESYLAVNKADLFSRVMKNMEYILAAKRQNDATHVRVVLVFTALDENPGEAQLFQAHFRKMFQDQCLDLPETVVGGIPTRLAGETASDLLLFRRKDNDNFLDQLRSRESYRHVAQSLGVSDVLLDRDSGRAPRCAAPFKTPTITWDGKVSVCEQDRFLKLKVGEITTEDLSEIWWRKDTVRELRGAVKRGELHQRLPCRDCRFPFSPNAPQLSEEELHRYQAILGRDFSV